ncbi:helix-turn-helix transcriptional regulator [Cryobacterium melibiosiphilum]|nr:helix-turn-helix transcriptional regulator [Cryobacterium melibiosiphilum]
MAGGSKSAPGPLTQEIATIIRERMARMKINDLALSRAIGEGRISRPQVQKIKAGTKQIDMEDLERICWALGLDFLATLAQADAATASRHVEPEWDVKPL